MPNDCKMNPHHTVTVIVWNRIEPNPLKTHCTTMVVLNSRLCLQSMCITGVDCHAHFLVDFTIFLANHILLWEWIMLCLCVFQLTGIWIVRQKLLQIFVWIYAMIFLRKNLGIECLKWILNVVLRDSEDIHL